MMRPFIKYATQGTVIAYLITVQPASAQSLEKLLEAVELGKAKEVAALLEQGLDVNSTGPQGQTILMAASRLGHLELVRLLIARKANPNRQSPTGDTALMMASLGGHLEIVKLLDGSGAEISSRGWTALHYAAFSGATDIVRFLVARGAARDAIAPNWDTPLTLAIRSGHLAAANALVSLGANVSHHDKDGQSVLSLAKVKGYTDLAEALRRAGATE